MLKRIKNKIVEKYWKIYRRFFDRYDLIKADTLSKTEYYETDTRILHCVMQSIVDFYDIEMTEYEKHEYNNFLKGNFTELEKEHILFIKAIKSIYIWWKNYPNREEEISKLYENNAPYKIIRKKEADLLKEEQTELMSAIAIRPKLWS